jgi:hypothetical protein
MKLGFQMGGPKAQQPQTRSRLLSPASNQGRDEQAVKSVFAERTDGSLVFLLENRNGLDLIVLFLSVGRAHMVSESQMGS